jgi:hypothetical protein
LVISGEEISDSDLFGKFDFSEGNQVFLLNQAKISKQSYRIVQVGIQKHDCTRERMTSIRIVECRFVRVDIALGKEHEYAFFFLRIANQLELFEKLA